MQRSDTMTVGELRELIKDMDDKTAVLIVAENAHNEALAVKPYPFETSLDRQGVLLLRPDVSCSVTFSDG